MNKTGISYLTDTWNPLAMKCTKCSPGCDHCWHLGWANRHASNPNFSDEVRAAYAGDRPPMLIEKRLSEPLKRRGPAMIGVQFMGDLFHENVAFEFVNRVFAVMALARHHTFLVLTKRPSRMLDFFTFSDVGDFISDVGVSTTRSREDAAFDEFLEAAVVNNLWSSLVRFAWPAPNVWLGVSVCNADEVWKIAELLEVPAGGYFVSLEPLLGAVDLMLAGALPPSNVGKMFVGDLCDDPACMRLSRHYPGEFGCRWNSVESYGAPGGLDLVIVGGESGSGARPMHPGWVRSVRDQCEAANVPFHFKQWGEWSPIGYQRYVDMPGWHGFDDGVAVERIGTKLAGHLLDGREHRALP